MEKKNNFESIALRTSSEPKKDPPVKEVYEKRAPVPPTQLSKTKQSETRTQFELNTF